MVSVEPEGGDARVIVDSDGVRIVADAAGLRDLGRWCFALAADDAPPGSHVHFDPGISPLVDGSEPLLLERDDQLVDDTGIEPVTPTVSR